MRILVVSDIHFAGEAEKARRGWEARAIRSPGLRWLAAGYRRYLWLADPTAHNHQLDAFLASSSNADLVVANGDYSCDSGFIGLADEAAYASAEECLVKLRSALGPRLLATIGDHELGKMSLFGGAGGLRLASWERTTADLGIASLWHHEIGRFVLIGVTSSLLALPVFAPELLPEERRTWEDLREEHMRALRQLLRGLRSDQRILLFCHDPSALPFLAREPVVLERLGQMERTVIGHLHSEKVLQAGRGLTGMPEIGFLGATVRRYSRALRRARAWKPFRVALCPSPSGLQLFKDGGYLELLLPAGASTKTAVVRHRLPWKSTLSDRL